MARLSSSLFAFAILFSLLPVVLSGPACAKKHWKAADCIQRCKSKWGFPGRMMGTNSWGVVMQKTEKQSEEVWNQALAAACGVTSDQSTSGGPVKADGALPNVSVSSTSSVTTSSSSVPSPVSTSSSTSSSSSSLISLSSTTVSSSTKPAPTVNKAIVKGALGGSETSSTSTSSSSPPPPPPSSSAPPKEAPKPQPTPAPQPKPEQPSSPSGGDVSGSGGGATGGGDIGTYLSAHNSVRAQHGAAPLSWSDNLASKAQQWANNCKFQHSGGSLGPFGENLAAGTGGSYDIQEAVKSWTDEVKDFNPGNPVPSHFTQVVWKGSTQVGCAEALCDGIFDASFGKAKYFVCEYSPQGNIIGQFAQNVQA